MNWNLVVVVTAAVTVGWGTGQAVFSEFSWLEISTVFLVAATGSSFIAFIHTMGKRRKEAHKERSL